MDLIEVDAASRTKVDDTRELLDNVQYAPTRGRYKVYLIDEVHMLSTHSFNALLKTLEEPPPHVKFLLATTDPQKLPVTVLSRCLQFNLKRLPVAEIAGQLRQILDAEGVPFDAAGVRLIAQAADGSMRDGLSLLDQLIAFGGGKAGEAEARAMLGTVARDHVVRIVELLAARGRRGRCCAVRRRWRSSPPTTRRCSMSSRRCWCGSASARPCRTTRAMSCTSRSCCGRLAQALSARGRAAVLPDRDHRPARPALAPDPRSGFEMTLLRMLASGPRAAPGSAPAGGGESRAAAARAAVAAPRAPPRQRVPPPRRRRLRTSAGPLPAAAGGRG